MEKILIEAENLTKIYPPDVTALDGVTVGIPAASVSVILGPSGSGKTTLLNLLGLLDSPSSGTVRRNGTDVSGLSSTEAARMRNEKYGFVFQFFHLIPELSVEENVFLPLWMKMKENRVGAYREKAREILKEFRLEAKAAMRPNQLSGGEKQRVSICRSLICGPEMIFADEPTGNLDRKAADELLDLILKLNKEKGMTFLIATHNENFLKIASKVIYLKDGRLEKEVP